MSAAKKIQTKENKQKSSHLKVIKGGLHPSSKKQKLINNYWTFCHSLFWSTEIFSEQQEAEFKKLIAEHFSDSKDAAKTFHQLVERAILVKRYIRRRKGRYVAKPIDWLNINFRFGLTATKAWLKEVNDQRKTVPHYNEGVAKLAEAIVRYSETRNVMDVAKYREVLIGLNQIDLLFFYTNAVVHFQFINY